MQNDEKWSKNGQKRGVSISALKPGPVVPPGTQNTPDQAARISQSVDFGHLSDILAILGVGSIFDVFSLFYVLHFHVFVFFCFSVFVTFCIFMILMIFSFSEFLDFCQFLSLFHVGDLFWSLFVSNLSAPTMTHFLSRIPALPLSPLLVVKFDHYFDT